MIRVNYPCLKGDFFGFFFWPTSLLHKEHTVTRWQLTLEFETPSVNPGGHVTPLETRTRHLSHPEPRTVRTGSTDTPCGLLGVKVNGALGPLCFTYERRSSTQWSLT